MGFDLLDTGTHRQVRVAEAAYRKRKGERMRADSQRRGGRRRWRLAGVIGAVAAALLMAIPTLANAAGDQHDGQSVGQRGDQHEGQHEGQSGDQPTPKVIGGHDATENYSFVVALTKDGTFGCAGSLIRSNWVVTAAHCAPEDGPDQVRVGSNDRTAGGETAGIAQTVVHPDYRPGQPGNDIALIRLDRELGKGIVAFARPGEPGTSTRVLGWGSTCEPAPSEECRELPTMLQELDTRVLRDSECNDFDAASELCNGGTPGAQACFGDSGGPLLAHGPHGWRLLGVTSRDGTSFDDETCADGPGIWSDVSAHLDWINQTIG